MAIKNICILGGTGFVGRHLAPLLIKQGYNLRILTRRRERHRDLLVLPGVEIIQADIHNSDTLLQNFSGMDAVINLVGVLNDDHGNGSFQSAHVVLARKVLSTCQKLDINRILHISALQAHSGKGSSKYLRSKGEAETIIHNTAHIAVTSFRPSVIFGPDDNFLNRFARLLKLTPAFLPFPLACPDSKFAPVFVMDVVQAIAESINNKETFGKRYDLCGPHRYTLKQLVEMTGQLTGEKRMIIGLGPALSKLQATLLGMVPGKPFTVDNYDSLKTDSVCKHPFPEEFGITPTALEAVTPQYLGHATNRDRYFSHRRVAGR